MINARAETVAEKPSFRAAFRQRRCLVAADGFYEWRKTAEAPKAPKQPYYIRLESGEPFAIAGLWERWRDPAGETVESCTLITTEANPALAPIHHRMPVILASADYDAWLDARPASPAALHDLLRPLPRRRDDCVPDQPPRQQRAQRRPGLHRGARLATNSIELFQPAPILSASPSRATRGGGRSADGEIST